MSKPKHSRSAEGLKLSAFPHNTSPHDHHELQKRYYSGYLEIHIEYTKDHWYVNPAIYGVLILRPMDQTQKGLYRDNGIMVYALPQFEMYAGFSLETSYTEPCGSFIGCDKFEVRDKSNTTKMPNSILIPHNKGILIPEEMQCS